LIQWSRLTRIIQRLREVFTVPSGGEYSPRRPLHLVRAEVVEIERHERLALGSVERLSARRPRLIGILPRTALGQ
jgi:hypothetical protein